MTMWNDIKRWTAKRKAALVMEIIQGKTSISEAESALEQALINRYGALGRVTVPFLLRSDNGLVERVIGMEVGLSLPSERVIRELKQIISWRGKPEVISCDNGPEYISAAIQAWAQEWGIRLEYIQPGKPQQNAYVERFNRTVRYEWLSQYYWSDLGEVQDFATKWMWSYNHDRPNMALGGFTPKQRLAMAA